MAALAVPPVLLILIPILVLLFGDFFSWEYWNVGDKTTATRSEVLRNVGLLIVGIVGLGFGVWRSYTAYQQTEAAKKQADVALKQAGIAERGHFTERFTKAIEQLGSESNPIRLGGIYALWRLAQDDPENNVVAVMDIFCAYVRNLPYQSSASETQADEEVSIEIISPDVQTILNLLLDSNALYGTIIPDNYMYNFSGANFGKADFFSADFEDAYLFRTNLSRAKMMSANFHDTYIYEANLSNSDLSDAILLNADLVKADLSGADLSRADLSQADLSEADLSGADLNGADLSGTDFEESKNLTQLQLDSACLSDLEDPPINLPDGLNPPTNLIEVPDDDDEIPF